MPDSNPHIRAVPNPPETNETRELLKTVALTSVVSSLVGVFAVAGGQALFNLLKRAIRGAPKEPPPSPAPAQPATNPGMPPPIDYEDPMPDALRMEPRLRTTGSRRRRPRKENAEEFGRMFSEFESRMGARFDAMERRIDNAFDEEEDDEEDEEE